MRQLPNSKRGEGLGGPVQTTDDPNDPSFDPSTHTTGTDKKICDLLSDQSIKLNDWEYSFLADVYGRVPLTRSQHIKVWKICKKYAKKPKGDDSSLP